MPKVSKPKEDLYDEAARKYLDSLTVKNQANLDYIAMMCDVDIPVEEQEGGNDL